MKLFSIALALLAFTLAPLASAQDKKPDAPPSPGKRDMDTVLLDVRMRKLVTDLALTDDQRDKMRPIIANEIAQFKSFRADEKLTEADRVRKEQEVREAAKPKLQAFLSAEQFAKYEAKYKRKGKAAAEPKAPKEPKAK